MAMVIRVRFKRASKLYDFDPNGLDLHNGMSVVTETARGVELGECMSGVIDVPDEHLAGPLKPILRIATEQDLLTQKRNEESEKEAFDIAVERIAEHNLEMKLVDVEYAFDHSKIIFYFTANGRVDFRMLVKNLAGIFKTRIELRQIGVRDEAKMLGGIGPCGRPICCRTFLSDFTPVSIKMAKEQNLSLNPTKISGVCGRLMCCLKYEQDNYEQTRKRMPKVGKEVITPDGNGVVWDLNIIKETVRVRIQKGDSSELKDFPLEEVQRVGAPAQQPAKKEAAPAAEEPAAETETAVEVSEEKPAEEQHHDEPKRERPRDKQLGKPVQRENPNRKDKQEGENHDRRQRKERGNQSKQDNQPKQDKPAEAPAAKPEAPKPAVSPWKQAVEAALKAAQEEKK